jgi:vacuolar-type H+-ATPase subunit H
MKDIDTILKAEKDANALLQNAEKDAQKIIAKAKQDALDFISQQKIDLGHDDDIEARSQELEKEKSQILKDAKRNVVRLQTAAGKKLKTAEKLVLDSIMKAQ